MRIWAGKVDFMERCRPIDRRMTSRYFETIHHEVGNTWEMKFSLLNA